MSGNVVVNQHGSVVDVDPMTWPRGEHLKKMLVKEGVEFLSETQKDPLYWQVCARWALLKKYGLVECEPTKMDHDGIDDKRELVFSKEQMATIQDSWKKVVASASEEDEDDDDGSNGAKEDLIEILSTGKSNKRELKWSTMNCKPGCQFKLHAHPNLEMIYCAKGNLHEVRMLGGPLTRDFENIPSGDDNDASKVKGPNLSSLDRPWYFSTFRQGEWLVNEVGSIHKSFTASKGDGCLLVCLWGGSHADVVPGEEPKEINVEDTVNLMDEKLGKCDCTKWETLEETFLPSSERSSPKRKLDEIEETIGEMKETEVKKKVAVSKE